ncbi:hypothetical protein R1CP_20835 [Rhodococcus opacus]|uniref:Uncharacterized protein n=1 Tax=Rhodococcus opacus TaxID=37919 RepID=A0A1B1K889_RHOOP|nr:hypothetical protein R1CP_20835 [Rhodococcus opacus]
MRTVCVDDLIGRAAIVEICPTVITRDEPAAERSEGLTVTNTLQNNPGRPSDRSLGRSDGKALHEPVCAVNLGFKLAVGAHSVDQDV